MVKNIAKDFQIWNGRMVKSLAKTNKLFVPRDKPTKRGARQHKKNLNKAEKRQKSQKRYKGQG